MEFQQSPVQSLLISISKTERGYGDVALLGDFVNQLATDVVFWLTERLGRLMYDIDNECRWCSTDIPTNNESQITNGRKSPDLLLNDTSKTSKTKYLFHSTETNPTTGFFEKLFPDVDEMIFGFLDGL